MLDHLRAGSEAFGVFFNSQSLATVLASIFQFLCSSLVVSTCELISPMLTANVFVSECEGDSLCGT